MKFVSRSIALSLSLMVVPMVAAKRLRGASMLKNDGADKTDTTSTLTNFDPAKSDHKLVTDAERRLLRELLVGLFSLDLPETGESFATSSSTEEKNNNHHYHRSLRNLFGNVDLVAPETSLGIFPLFESLPVDGEYNILETAGGINDPFVEIATPLLLELVSEGVASANPLVEEIPFPELFVPLLLGDTGDDGDVTDLFEIGGGDE